MKNYIDITRSSDLHYKFMPSSVHSIKLNKPTHQVFGGVLHALACSAAKDHSSLPVVSVSTFFKTKAEASEDLDVHLDVLIDKKIKFYQVYIKQNNILVSTSFVTCSSLNNLSTNINNSVSLEDISYTHHHTWPWDPDKKMILGHLNTHMQVKKNKINTTMSIDGYKTDLLVSTTLSDMIAPLFAFTHSKVGTTHSLITDFFVDQFPQEIHAEYKPLGICNGVSFAELIQRDSFGNLLSHTKGSALLQDMPF